MEFTKIIVIGASAGGVEALSKLAAQLRPSLTCPILMVLHIPPYAPTLMPSILSKVGQLPATEAKDGERMVPGHIYVAPPDHHLLVQPGTIQISRGPRVNRHRPAVDPLFRSAARAYGSGTIGVILSGYLDDGCAGLIDIKNAGGIAIVQDPRDAHVPSMPENAMRCTEVDFCVEVGKMGKLLHELSREKEPVIKSKRSKDPQPVPNEAKSIEETTELRGPPSGFTCPECNGSLWEVKNGKLLQFKCYEGHAYSADSLLQDQGDEVERALWTAARTLDERAAIMRRLAREMGTQKSSGKSFIERADEYETHARTIRGILSGTKLTI